MATRRKQTKKLDPRVISLQSVIDMQKDTINRMQREINKQVDRINALTYELTQKNQHITAILSGMFLMSSQIKNQNVLLLDNGICGLHKDGKGLFKFNNDKVALAVPDE